MEYVGYGKFMVNKNGRNFIVIDTEKRKRVTERRMNNIRRVSLNLLRFLLVLGFIFIIGRVGAVDMQDQIASSHLPSLVTVGEGEFVK